VTIQEPTQVTSCYNLLAPVLQLSSNSRSARMSFSQVQRVFIVEYCLVSRSYLTCQKEFRDTFLDSPVTNKSTVSRLVNCFRDTETPPGCIKHEKKSECMRRWTRWTFPERTVTLFFFVFWFIDKQDICQEWAWLFDHSVLWKFWFHLWFHRSTLNRKPGLPNCT
jgi:hypothetical protein